MKSNALREFDILPEHEWQSYVKKATFLQNKGLHTDLDVLQLANEIYKKSKINENKGS